MADPGRPLFQVLQYCVRCCIPETEDGTTFDELGICQACRSSEEKMHIDWVERDRELRRILDEAKAKAGNNYDCVIPISGGKDSTFQLHTLVNVYKVKPLAVTFSHNWFSETGWYNLLNALETFNVDHIMFTPSRSLVNRMAKRSLFAIGDACWHCHAGVDAFPMQAAVRFNIPLIVYGEPPAEGHGMSSYSKPLRMTREESLKVSAKVTPREMVSETLSERDLYPFEVPTQEEFDRVGIHKIFLGDYIFWDDERQTEFVRDTYGWRETEMEGTYKRYKSAECIMPGVHDFTLYLKRGYGRGTTQANVDVRNGLLTREEGFALARRHDTERPEALDYFLKITGMTDEEFYEAMKSHRMGRLNEVEMPIRAREKPNAERMLPVAEQILERYRMNQADTPQQRHSSSLRHGDGNLDLLFDLSIGQILDAFQANKLSPVDIAQLCIDRIDRLEAQHHAWSALDPEALMAQARQAEARLARGDACRLLEGIPIGVKDVFNTKDLPTQMGSPLWKGFTPGNDARSVFHVKRAGGLIAGKTVTAEFAVHTLGKTLNPHNASRNPGTSSSGSAAAIVLGMVPVSLGTQTAASIVRPASFCGVYGCKPSFGLIPRTGILKTTDSLDTVGFFAVHFEDLSRIYEVLRVDGPNYPVAHAALNDPSRQSKPPGRPWRVALARTHTWDQASPYAQQALMDWAQKLSREPDIEVTEVGLPSEAERSHEIHAAIYERSLANYFKDEFNKSELVSPILNDMIKRGLAVTAEQYHKGLKDQEVLARKVEELMQSYDVMISLSTAGEAPLREEPERQDPGLLWTMTHLPVISAPVFTSPGGLPFGVQLAARRYNDPLLFKFGEHLRSLDLIPEGPNPRLKLGI